MRIFNAESPLMEWLSRISDLVILNLVVLVCCLPVITIGAAMTGMHYVLLKMARDEEGYIVRSYFKSFRQNFLQATGMWFVFLFTGSVIGLDLWLTGDSGGTAVHLPAVFHYLILAGGIYLFLIYLYAFPLLARFQNTIPGTLRNAAVLAVASFPRTVAMVFATFAIPVAVWLYRPVTPFFLLAGLTAPGYVCALLYSPVFRKIEGSVDEMNEGDEENEENEEDGITEDGT